MPGQLKMQLAATECHNGRPNSVRVLYIIRKMLYNRNTSSTYEEYTIMEDRIWTTKESSYSISLME